MTLAAMRRGDEVVFKVSDRGRGIAPEALERVFDRFESQTSGSRHRGPGLGLSIVRALVELHGGRVTINSVLGEGTTVTCIFPIGAARSARECGRLKWPSRRNADGEALETSISPTRRRRRRSRAGSRVLPARAILSRLRGDLGAGKTAFARAYLQGPDRRSRARGAEPDLHADPDLRRSGLSGRPRRFLSPARRRGAHPARLGRDDRGRGHAGRMAGARRRRAARRPAGDRAVVRSRARRRIPPRRVVARGAMAARFKLARAIEIPARRRRLGGGAAGAAARRRLDARLRAADRRVTAGPRS